MGSSQLTLDPSQGFTQVYFHQVKAVGGEDWSLGRAQTKPIFLILLPEIATYKFHLTQPFENNKYSLYVFTL